VIWAAICGQFKSSLVIWDRKHGTINSKTFVEHILPVCKLCPPKSLRQTLHDFWKDCNEDHEPISAFGQQCIVQMDKAPALNSPEPLSPIWDWSCLTGLATHLTSILLKVFGHCSKNASTSYVRSHTLESR